MTDDTCFNCGGPIAIRNPTGHCDHLYWPENVPKKPHPMTDAHDAKARETAWEYLFPEAPLLEWEEHGSSYRDLVKLISIALRDCERETINRAAKVAEVAPHMANGIDIAALIRALAQEEQT